MMFGHGVIPPEGPYGQAFCWKIFLFGGQGGSEAKPKPVALLG